MFESWKKGQSFKVVRNPNYWQAGKPYLDSVTFTSVPDDNTRALQLEGGQAQINMSPPFSSIESLKTKPGIVVTLFPSTRMDMILLNEQYAPFKDVHVRRAINYAIDRKAIVSAVTLRQRAAGQLLHAADAALLRREPARAGRRPHEGQGGAGGVDVSRTASTSSS